MTRLRALASLFGIAWRARRAVLVGYLFLLGTDVLAIGMFGLGLRALIRSAMRGDAPGALLAAGVVSVCWTIASAGSSARTNMAYLLAESVSVELDERILGLLVMSGDMRRQETPQYADQLALLRRGGDLMGHHALGLLDVATTFLRLTVVLALLAMVQPALLLLALVLIPVLWVQRRGRKRIAQGIVETAPDVRLADHLFSLHTDPTSAMEIRIAGALETLQERADQVWAVAVRRQERARLGAAAMDIAGWAAFMAAYAVALLFVSESVSAGQADPGDVLMVLTLTVTLRNQAGEAIVQLQRTAEGAHVLAAYLAVQADGSTLPVPGHFAVPARLHTGIVLRQVSFSYPAADRPVLRRLDLDLPAGSMVAVVGEHGAGKTTLVKLLCGLYRPMSGTITVDGVALERIPHDQWCRRVTASFQDFAEFAWVARESIGCGDLPRIGDRARIRQAVSDADATQLVAGLPSGLDTRLGGLFGGVELSGGQWQRIALSRAFMRDAPLLFVLDEPTASLDARSEHVVYQRQVVHARRLARITGAVTVVISHRFSTVRMADRIVVLADGGVAEAGSHEELMDLGGAYSELYDLQARGYHAATGVLQAGGRRTDEEAATSMPVGEEG